MIFEVTDLPSDDPNWTVPQRLFEPFKPLPSWDETVDRIEQEATDPLARLTWLKQNKPEAAPAVNIKLYTLADLESLPPPTWLVRDHVPVETIGVIYGESGSYKSFYTLDLALCVAFGRTFVGKYKTKPAPVVYLAGEGKGSIRYRIRAWMKYHAKDTLPDHFRVIPVPFPVTEPVPAAELLAQIEKEVGRPGLIVVDVLSKYFGFGDENTAKDMKKYMDALTHIRDKTGASIITIHHAGKNLGAGERGSSLLRAESDFRFFVEKGGTQLTVSNPKQRDAEEIEEYPLVRKIVDLGIKDEDGKPITSLVLVPLWDEGRRKLALLKGAPKKNLLALWAAFNTRPFTREQAGKVLGKSEAQVRKDLKTLKEGGFLEDSEPTIPPHHHIRPEFGNGLMRQDILAQ